MARKHLTGWSRPRRQDADEVVRLVRTARTLPLRFIRVSAQRTRAIYGSVGEVRRDDLFRRGALLHPLIQRAQHVETGGARTAGAMLHAGNHEQSIELAGIAIAVVAVVP